MMQRIYKTIFVLSWLKLLVVVVYTTLLRLFKNPLFRRCLRILAGVGLLCLGIAALLPIIPGVFLLIPAIHLLFGKDIIQIAKRIIRRWRRYGRTPGT